MRWSKPVREKEVFTYLDNLYGIFRQSLKTREERASFSLGVELASDMLRAIVDDLQDQLEREGTDDDL